jgi:hypothetical protein
MEQDIRASVWQAEYDLSPAFLLAFLRIEGGSNEKKRSYFLVVDFLVVDFLVVDFLVVDFLMVAQKA